MSEPSPSQKAAGEALAELHLHEVRERFPDEFREHSRRVAEGLEWMFRQPSAVSASNPKAIAAIADAMREMVREMTGVDSFDDNDQDN